MDLIRAVLESSKSLVAILVAVVLGALVAILVWNELELHALLDADPLAMRQGLGVGLILALAGVVRVEWYWHPADCECSEKQIPDRSVALRSLHGRSS